MKLIHAALLTLCLAALHHVRADNKDQPPIESRQLVGFNLPDMTVNWIVIATGLLFVTFCVTCLCVSHVGDYLLSIIDPEGHFTNFMAIACPGCPCGQDSDQIVICTVS